MKTLLYKEFKLALHPIIHFFILFFPFLILTPTYPIGICFIYVLTCYPVLFLGTNKGQQSNDLLYTALLPVRKKDIVKARMLMVSTLQIVYTVLMSALLPVAIIIKFNNPEIGDVGGIPLEGFFLCAGISLVMLSISDLIMFALYYRNGKSIVLSSLSSIFFFCIVNSIITIAFPYIPAFEPFFSLFYSEGIMHLGAQFIALGICCLIAFGIKIVTVRIGSKLLEKVDF